MPPTASRSLRGRRPPAGMTATSSSCRTAPPRRCSPRRSTSMGRAWAVAATPTRVPARAAGAPSARATTRAPPVSCPARGRCCWRSRSSAGIGAGVGQPPHSTSRLVLDQERAPESSVALVTGEVLQCRSLEPCYEKQGREATQLTSLVVLVAVLERLLLRRAVEGDLARLGLGLLVGTQGQYAAFESGLDVVRVERVAERHAVGIASVVRLPADRQHSILERQLDVGGAEAGHVGRQDRGVVRVLNTDRRRVGCPDRFAARRLPAQQIINQTQRIPSEEGPGASTIRKRNESVHVWDLLSGLR